MSVVRAAVQNRADTTSLHATAEEIGLSYTGLRGFLKGGKPQPKTRELLLGWYTHQRDGQSQQGLRLRTEDVDAAVALLSLYLRSEKRMTVRGRRFTELTERIASEADLELT